MVKCPNCSEELKLKEGQKKFCAQIGNPEIAIVTTESPHFCSNCNEYFMNTTEIIKAINQIAKSKAEGTKSIEAGIYK